MANRVFRVKQIEPVMLNTYESLTSYFIRLATAHAISLRKSFQEGTLQESANYSDTQTLQHRDAECAEKKDEE
jgi:hypothetical protein